MPSLLVVDDEEGMRKSLAILFQKEGYTVSEARNGETAIDTIRKKTFDLVITDLRMGCVSGLDFLEYIKDRRMRLPVIVMTGFGTIESAVTAMKMGASDYITKPFEYEEIVHRARQAIKMAETDREMASMLRGKAAVDERGFSAFVVGESPAMKEIKAQLRKISGNDLPVLITGETGTGKSLLAKAVHLNSSRAAGPFISVNCTSIPENLMESEFFGHAKGAFTGALMERKGLFEAAQGGTLLLDEIGSIPKPMQAKLLGVLQDNIIRKVGSNDEVPLNVRVIAATNVDLPAAIKKGDFREDLYYRMNVLHLHLPSLRAHREDIPLLADHFLSVCKVKQNMPDVAGFAPDVMQRLYRYDYPGNVRELFNVICHAVVVSNGEIISEDDLPVMTQASGPAVASPEAGSLDMGEWEKRIILETIKRHPRNLAEVCKELKIGRTTLWRKMKQYKIDNLLG